MLPAYQDILDRIAEEPSWFDVHGVPRYGPPPESLLPFMGRIACQRCDQEFWVCLVGEIYFGLGDESIAVVLGDPCPANPEERHAQVEVRSMNRFNPQTGRWEPLPLPENWHYGDPPSHGGCIGETMNSIPEYDWEEWRRGRG